MWWPYPLQPPPITYQTNTFSTVFPALSEDVPLPTSLLSGALFQSAFVLELFLAAFIYEIVF